MSPVNLSADEITDGAADERVGGKVLIGGDARGTDGSRATVGKQLGQRSRVFVSEDGSDRPGGGGMFRGEGITLRPEIAVPIALIRPIALRNALDGVGERKAVERRFPAQNAGLAHLVVVVWLCPTARLRR